MTANKELKEKMVLTSFSIEPERREEYERLFHKMGLNSWANGIRFALREFYNNHANDKKSVLDKN